MQTVLIAGASGFLGSHLLRGLNGTFKTVGLARPSSDISKLSGAEIITGTVSDLDSIVKRVRPDFVVNAVVSYSENEEESYSANVDFALRLVTCSGSFGISCFVQFDTFFLKSNVPYDYLRTYQQTKRELVNSLDTELGMPIVNLRIEHMYGPGDRAEKFIPSLIRRLKQNEPVIPLTGGEQKRDFVFVDDVAEAVKRVLQHSKEFKAGLSTIEVGTGNSVSFKDFITEAKRVTKSSSELQFGVLPYREGEPMNSAADTAVLRGFGWAARVPIREGIQAVADSIK